MSANILVAEDEAMIAMQIEMDLEDAGYTVVGPFMSLENCMMALKTEIVDAAVLDVDLAGFDVFPIAFKLEERGTPFVFHTGRGLHQKIQEKFPHASICTKPAEVPLLLQKLNLPPSM